MNFKRFIVVFLLLFFPTVTTCLAQDAAADVSKVIRGIELRGLHNLAKGDVLNRVAFTSRVGRSLLQESVERDVSELYLMGYFSSVSTEVRPARNGVILVYNVVEYPKIERVEFNGMTRFSKDYFRQKIRNRKGQVFNVGDLDADIKFIESSYQEQGYDLQRVVTAGLVTGNVLAFNLEEGRVASVAFTGLSKTREFVLRRELSQREGAVFNTAAVRRDRLQLLRMGYFSDVGQPTIAPLTGSNEVTLVYPMMEKKINFFDFGLEQLRDLDGTAAFFRIYYNHLFLYSDVISAKTQMLYANDGVTLRSYSLRYYQPWLMNILPVSWAWDVWTEFRNEAFSGETALHSNRRVGMSSTFGIPLIRNEMTFYPKVKYENVEPWNGESFQSYSIRSLSGALNYDVRDNLSNPTEGGYVVLSAERGGNFRYFNLGGLDFTRWSANGAVFQKLSDQDVLALHGNYGVFRRDTFETLSTFESEQFPLGGSTSLRGYQEQAFRGNYRIFFNVELRHKISQDLQGVLFSDFGNVYQTIPVFNPATFQYGSGFGLRLQTGIAPIRVDFGWGEDFIIHFNLGQAF